MDTLPHIDYERALLLLEKAVWEKGANHLVPVCRYTWNGQPNCIIGVALSYEGVTIPEDATGANLNSEVPDNITRVPLLDGVYVHLTPKALTLWEAVQEVQDQGFSWGYAIERAVEVVHNIGVTNDEF